MSRGLKAFGAYESMVSSISQVKLVVENVKEALSSMDETIQLQEKDKLTHAAPASASDAS